MLIGNEYEPANNALSIKSFHGFHKVVDRLRDVALRNNPIPDFHPYWQSTITLEEVKITDLYPCALYVLNSNLTRAQEIRRTFLSQGIDPLAMKIDMSLIKYTYKDRKDCKITPPLVEVSEDDGGIMIITDGLHRVTEAKRAGLDKITVTKVQDIAFPLPVLPVKWQEVQAVDTVPTADQKRRFRFNNMEEIENWKIINIERFQKGFDLGDSFMRRVLEKEKIRSTYPVSPYSPWDYPVG